MIKYDLHYKLLFLGESSVGKTSLLLRYIDDKFENSIPTVGIDVKYKYLTYDNKKIRLDIWDTAGQERFKGIAQNYFRGAHGIIFVFDITNKDSFNKLKNWISDAKQKINPGTLLAVAENKIDLEERRVISKEKIEEFREKNDIDIFRTSAKTGEGVREIIANMVSQLYNNKKIGIIEDDDEDEESRRRNSVALDRKKTGKNNERCNC